VSEGAGLAALGAVIGLAIAFAGSGILATLVFGIGTRDAVTFAAVPIAILSLAALAAWLPARRAARAEPMSALRAE
jgi:putative ABC transport system permease protein